MIFKIAYRNIKKSIKDYAIYFFTVMIGVAIFYVFNAIKTQTAMLKLGQSSSEITSLLTNLLSAVSILVSIILGALIIYANSFLIKRRHKEFGVYIMLGMEKKQVSFILFLETLLVGLFSLLVGLVLGAILSQGMGLLVVHMFKVDMSRFHFVFSLHAMIKTIVYFGIMYLIVMLFNTISISKVQVISLLRKKENEEMKLGHPLLSSAIFIIGVGILSYAYYLVTNQNALSKLLEKNVSGIFLPIILGVIATFMIIFGFSTIAIMIVKHSKLYHKGLNTFTVTQISSQIKTMTVSLSLITLMLFFTICLLSTSSNLTRSINTFYSKTNTCDVSIRAWNTTGSLASMLKDHHYNVNEHLKDYVEVKGYQSKLNEVNYAKLFGSKSGLSKQTFASYEKMPLEMLSVSNYNKLAKALHEKQYTLKKDHYLVICDASGAKDYFNKGLSEKPVLTINHHKLQPQYLTSQSGRTDLSSYSSGILIVSDNVFQNIKGYDSTTYLLGNYRGNDEKEEALLNQTLKDMTKNRQENDFNYVSYTKLSLQASSTGLRVIVTFIALYIGIIFLISSAAILALKALTHMNDSQSRYIILNKIGCEKHELHGSILKQNLVLFLIPLILACIHSVAGLKFTSYFTDMMGSGNAATPAVSTMLILAAIYGGYFLVTYVLCRNMCDHYIDQ